MTTQLFLQFLGIYCLGQILHLCFWDFPLAKKHAKIANVSFKPLDILKEDWYLWVGNIILGISLLLVLNEMHYITDRITGKERLFFLFMGGFGSFAIQTRWSRIQKKIDNIVDKKTNIADNVQPDVNPQPEPPLKNEPNA